MRTQTTIAVAALLLAAALPAAAQSDKEAERERAKQEKAAAEQMDRAREQMRQAEREMREAEREMERAARELAEVKTHEKLKQIEENELRRKVVFFGGRPRLGLVFRSEANSATDPIGATVVAVTPASPAEEAGLKVGDIIVKVNGERVADGTADVDEDESPATARFMELAGDLDEGDEVALDYKRGNEQKTVKIKARRLGGPDVRVFVDREPLEIGAALDDAEKYEFELLRSPWQDIELAAINPELGAYFGAAEGVLVVKPSKDASLQLKGGDVLLSIGDRAATSPAQVMRVLRSYEPGEKVALRLLRGRQELRLEAKAPERARGRLLVAPPAAPAPPAPPEAPAHPAAPAPPAKATRPGNTTV